MQDLTAYAEIFNTISCLDVSLNEKLAKHFVSVKKINPTLAAIYEEMIETWDHADAAANIPGPGETFPAFILPNQEGRLVSSAAFLERGPLVISFNRGHWCPYCRHELLELKKTYEAIRGLGADVVSIMPDRTAFTRPVVERLELPFQILSDMDQSLSMTVGLMAPIGPKVQELYRSIGFDLPKFQDVQGWNVPVPGTFLVGQDGRVLRSYANPDIRKRMPMEEILAGLGDTGS